MEVSLSEMRQKGQVYFCGIIRDLTQVVADRETFEKQAETLELALQAGELGLWDWISQREKSRFRNGVRKLVAIHG